MLQSRILIKDQNNQWRKVLGVSTNFTDTTSDLYFLIPNRFEAIVNSGQSPYSEIHTPTDAVQNTRVTDVHIRYPTDGRFHITARNENQIVQERNYVEHEPLDSLTPGKRILSVIPRSAEHYPVYEQRDEEYAWRIEGVAIPDFFDNVPIQLNFWVGTGSNEDLVTKINSIKQIEMQETLRYAEVYGGQDNHIQLFMAITRPQTLTEFSNIMRLWMHPINALRLRRRVIDSEGNS